MQVENSNADDTIYLIESMPYDVEGGDSFTIYAGCDRRAYTCKNRFNNFPNFRGFPNLPGLDKIVVIPMNVQWTEF